MNTYKFKLAEYFYSMDTYKTTLKEAKNFIREFLNVSKLPKNIEIYK